MKNVLTVLFSLFVTLSCPAMVTSGDDKIPAQFKREIVQDLTENILPFWATRSPDLSGGFYGTLMFDGTPDAKADKAGILNARLLWTFSAAWRILHDEKYRLLADRAQRYFLDHFIDKEYGGSFYTVHAGGTPADMHKDTYQNAFAIYGLSEHYRATGNRESLEAAVDIFSRLVKYAYDPVNGGFIESFTREWQMIEVKSPKTMNTNLHVLEALTNLYRVWKNGELKKHLQEEIDVMSHKVLNQATWHEHLFLTMDWQNLLNMDSYGHDIEFSWLLVEAAEVLGDEDILNDTRRIAVNLVNVQLEQGLDAEGAMMYEKSDGHLNATLEWWPQAETVTGCLNAWQISGDKKFLDAAVRTWEWIKTHMIDYEYGEWYGGVNPDGTPQKQRVKADRWRCPYHNTRMGFEIITRFSPEAWGKPPGSGVNPHGFGVNPH
jgi:mannobiose 2-epimerase